MATGRERSSILSNAQNVQVNGGQFTVTSNSTVVEGPRNASVIEGIDHLRERSALAALVDSGERLDPPKCDPDTRISIIKQIMEWVKSEEEANPVMWLLGSAGAGKSALAQTLSELCKKEGKLAASFFFSRIALNRSDGRALIPTIAYQLALSLPEATYSFRRAVERDLSIFDLSNATQAEKLLVAPVNSWISLIQYCFTGTLHFQWFVPLQRRLIVIDGLDECYDQTMQCDLIKIMCKTIKRLRLPFRLLITSRPESHILRTFNEDDTVQSVGVTKVDLREDQNASNDIHKFLRKQFQGIRQLHPIGPYLRNSWPGEAAITELVHRSSGQFIYAKTVIIYIQSPKHRPDDRLQVVLGLMPRPADDSNSPYAQLDALYMHIFSTISESDIYFVLRILAVLIIPRVRHDNLGDYTSPAQIERLLRFKPGDVELIFNDLMSIVFIRDSDTPVKMLHASLADFLQDQERSGKFRVDIRLAHELLAKGFFKCISEYNRNSLFEQRDSCVVPFETHCIKAGVWSEMEETLERNGLLYLYNNFHRASLGKRQKIHIPYIWFILERYFENYFVSTP